jgi:hypothetical protein
MMSVRKPSDAMGTETTVAGGCDETDPEIVNPAAPAKTGLFRSADTKAARPNLRTRRLTRGSIMSRRALLSLGPSYLGHLLILVVMVSIASKILCRNVFKTFNAVRMERSKMDEQRYESRNRNNERNQPAEQKY